MKNDRKLIRKIDILIIVSLIILAALFYGLQKFGLAQQDRPAREAVVTLDKTIIDRIPLDRSGSYTCPEAPDVVFTVENGTVRISENDCKDKICMRTGAISLKSEAIVCMPKKIAVTITDGDSGLDVVLQ